MLTRADVQEIAGLARLSLDEAQIEKLRDELAAILEMMARLESVPTDGVPPMTHAVPMELRLRPDRVGESLPVEVALADAPDQDADCFRVPNILDSGSGNP